jgi:multiple sugar transport system permease protein
MTSKKRKSLRSHQQLSAWMMGLPGLAILFTFVLLPLILGGYWSLTNQRLISPVPSRFVGLENYRNLLSVKVLSLNEEIASRGLDAPEVTNPLREILRSDPEFDGYREWFRLEGDQSTRIVIASDVVFMKSLVNTLIFVLVIVPGQGALALLLALLVNQKIKGRNAFRTIYFAPVVTSMAVIAIVWAFLYNPQHGVINAVLNKITFGSVGEIGWLVDTRYALAAIIIVSAWQAAGFQMVIFLAGLQGIPQYLYEQAEIDGAGRFRKFANVTLPQLRNTTIFVIISTTILAFRVFTQVDVMTRGGPQNATSTVVYHAVNQGFRQQRIGYASAITMVFFVIVLAVAFVQKVMLKSEKEME